MNWFRRLSWTSWLVSNATDYVTRSCPSRWLAAQEYHGMTTRRPAGGKASSSEWPLQSHSQSEASCRTEWLSCCRLGIVKHVFVVARFVEMSVEIVCYVELRTRKRRSNLVWTVYEHWLSYKNSIMYVEWLYQGLTELMLLVMLLFVPFICYLCCLL